MRKQNITNVCKKKFLTLVKFKSAFKLLPIGVRVAHRGRGAMQSKVDFCLTSALTSFRAPSLYIEPHRTFIFVCDKPYFNCGKGLRNIKSIYLLTCLTFFFFCFQELIQNADDAKATEVIFIHDERSYGTESLWTTELKEYQGITRVTVRVSNSCNQIGNAFYDI